MKKIKSIITRNINWWTVKGLPFKYRVSFNLHQIIALLRAAFTGEKKLFYLGNSFEYDHPFAPITMQNYPHEILEKVLANTKTDIQSVLDIGGNIGQFSVTFNSLVEGSQIDVFEPNSEVFKMLQRNVQANRDIRIFNYGIGSSSVEKMYYRKGRSSTGSVLEENADKGNTDTLSEITIEMIQDVSKVTGKDTYDLIKIDVEGYEFELLKHMKSIKTKYLFIEITGAAKKKEFKTSELFSRIVDAFGEFDIVYNTELDREDTISELLLEF